jgi:hypothetical protein
VAQVAEHLPSKKTLSSTPSSTPKKRKKEKRVAFLEKGVPYLTEGSGLLLLMLNTDNNFPPPEETMDLHNTPAGFGIC